MRGLIVCCCLLLAPCALAEVVLQGVGGRLEANVLAHLRIDDETCDAEPDRVRHRFEAAEAQIREALEPFGYYAPAVSSLLVFPRKDCWKATFEIAPGERVRLRHVRVEVAGEAATAPEFVSILEGSPLVSGAPLDHADYERVKGQLVVTARELGYFEAALVQHELRVRPQSLAADVTLVLDSGPRYRFGALDIESDHLRTDLVRRFVTFEPGAPFEQRVLRELRNDLVQSEYFGEVDVRTETRADHTVDVLVALTRGRRLRYGIGLGFGTDTGFVVRGDFLDRWFNSAGHQIELDAKLAQVEQIATFDYRIPGERPQRDWYSVYGGYNQKDSDAILTRGWKLGVRDTHYHTRRWHSNRFLENVVDRFQQDGDWQQQQTLVPGYSMTFLAADAPDRPTRGIRLTGEVLGASDSLLSDVSFLRLKASGKTILPLTARGRLLVRAEAGWMETDAFDDVPPTWRFYAGGDNSVRGYDYQSLGPLDEEGKSLGGERLITASTEVDWRVRERWSVALFTDAGNVGKGELLDDFAWSVGVGARWYSPLGPIRVDLAFPQTGDGSFRVHVSMGPDL